MTELRDRCLAMLEEQGQQLSFGPELHAQLMPQLRAAAAAGGRAEVESLVRLGLALEARPGAQAAGEALWELLRACPEVARLYGGGLDGRRAQQASRLLARPTPARLNPDPAPAGTVKAGLLLAHQGILRR